LIAGLVGAAGHAPHLAAQYELPPLQLVQLGCQSTDLAIDFLRPDQELPHGLFRGHALHFPPS
jgi:hypothetical protein